MRARCPALALRAALPALPALLGLLLCWSALGCSARTSGPAAVAAKMDSPVELRPLGPWLGASGRGMGRVRVELENLEDRPHSGYLILNGDSWRIRLEQSAPFELEPHEKRAVELRFPAFVLSDGDLNLSLRADGAQRAASLTVAGLGHERAASTRVLVIENRRRAAGWEADRAAALGAATRVPLEPGGTVRPPVPAPPVSSGRAGLSGLGYIATALPTGPGTSTYAVGRIAPTELPPDADALQGYDAVVLDRSSESPGPEALAALEVFLRRGGNLVLAGGADARWSPEWLERYAPERFGFASASLPEPVRRAGHGMLVLSDGPPLEPPGQLTSITSLLDQLPSALPAGTESFSSLRLGAFPAATLPGTLAADPRLMCIVVLAILALLGPVVLTFVRRSGRPALLLLAVPVASLITTVGVVGYGLLKDGVGLKLALEQRLLLDQRTQRISAQEGRVYFAGPMVKSQLRPGSGSLVTPAPELGSFAYSRRWTYRVSDTDGLVLSGDLFPKRQACELAVLADRSTRARLEVDFSGDRPRVANALGAELEQLELVGPDGRRWGLTGELAAGASQVLERRPGDLAADQDFDPRGLVRGSYEALLAAPLAFDDLGQPDYDLEQSGTRLVGILDLGDEDGGGSR